VFLEEVNRAKEAAGRENESDRRGDALRKLSRRGRGGGRQSMRDQADVFPASSSEQPKSRQDLLREVCGRCPRVLSRLQSPPCRQPLEG
jgi:hypothetical protein